MEFVIAFGIVIVLLTGIVVYSMVSDAYRTSKIRQEYLASLSQRWDDSEVRDLIANLESEDQTIIYVHETLQ